MQHNISTMAINKDAYSRYLVLDELFQTRRDLTTTSLTIEVNKRLDEDKAVTQRQIQKDINDMMCKPFEAPIQTKGWYRYYTDSSYSILNIELSGEERRLLYEVLSSLGQFDGLEHFELLKRYTIGLHLEERPQVFSFTNAPYLQNSNLIGLLFDIISNQQVIWVKYHPYNKKMVSHLLHPYLLKQYNSRWYLIGGIDSDGFIVNFPLDRIEDIKVEPKVKYKPCNEDLSLRFKDIVGVTLTKGEEFQYVTLWADDKTFPYLETKHIVRFQENVTGEEEIFLRKQYPDLQGGHFIRLYTLDNFELRRELCSNFGGILVLSPKTLQDEIFKEIDDMHRKYIKLRS